MRRALKRVALPIALVGAVAAAVLVSAPAASAAPSAPHALSGFMLYQNSNYGGGDRRFTSSLTEFAGTKWNNGDSMQNSASSMQNFTNSYVGMWDIGTSCTGSSYTAKPGSQDSSFSNNNFNDHASCLKFL